jgi:tetratricopeptide (TPR) repeat protein
MEAYNNLGNALKQQELYTEAIEAFNRSLTIKQDSAEVYTNLGNTYRKTGQIDDAIAALNKALTLKPELALAHLNLALIYLSERKDNNRALFHLKKTIELDPFIPQAEAIQKKIAELIPKSP